MEMNLGVMILISIIAGFLSTMNIWAVSWRHTRLHLNDVYMVALMVLWMVALYSLYASMYCVAAICVVLIAMTMYLIRKQVGVSDKQFLSGMIPHHSMAIQMAQNIRDKTKDTRIQKLANEIIDAQNKEIQLMETLEKD